MNPIIKSAIIWFFLAFLPLAIIVNLAIKSKNCCIVWTISVLGAMGLSACFARISLEGYQRYAVVWFLMMAVIMVTFALSKKTGDGFLNATRAAVLSIVTVIGPFVMTLLNQYWPTFTISHVSNSPGFECRADANNHVALPSHSAVYVKNQSQSVLTNTQLRYLFISSKGDGTEDRVIDNSFSQEYFNFGPQEERAFLFSFQNLEQHDHLFLVAEVRHRPLLWPFTVLKEWQVFNYAPQDCLWVTMRKSDSQWRERFSRWGSTLDQNG